MKKINVSWDTVPDSTGYLFSLAKALACAVQNSPWAEYAEDIVATSGFAFRLWVSPDLCPSATSIWDFGGQKPWVESGGLQCKYVGRYWGQEAMEEEKRLEALANIRESIDRGVPAVSWDIGVPEWGLITGYDDDTQTLSTLAINAQKADPTSPLYNSAEMPYKALGKRELPILSVLTITGKSDKSQEDIYMDTLRMAANHLRGGEWCDNAKGLAAYPALIRHFEEAFNPAASWNMEYFLGTYAALKQYAWKYLCKWDAALGAQYKGIFDAWQEAFHIKAKQDINLAENRARIASLLRRAEALETEAVEKMLKT